ncbi:MAG TPA: competence/damage-inducible protein A, partial [Roseiflexaceae bacterium]
SRAEAEALAEQAAATIRVRLGEHLIGEEPLAQAVARLLDARGISLALYEGNDRAPVYRALAATELGRKNLRGAIIHPLDRPADQAAAVSLARSGALAARDRWRSTLALGVQPASTPSADGFTSVAVALEHPSGVAEVTRRYDLNLDEGWDVVGTLALDVIRRFLLEG